MGLHGDRHPTDAPFRQGDTVGNAWTLITSRQHVRLIAKHDELVRVFHERALIDCERDFKTIGTLEDACNTAADFEQIYRVSVRCHHGRCILRIGGR